MIDIKLLEKSWFFESFTLKKKEVLFDEWDIDTNLYIVKSWKIVIEKYTDYTKNDLKELAILEKNDIFWEWSLSNKAPKEVRISALENSQLLKIDWIKNFEEFLKKDTKLGIDLLSSIIDTTNKRLLESNFLVTSSYTLIKFISEISDFDNRNLFSIIDRLLKIMGASFIIYFEKVPGLKDYFNIKYDTRDSWKMQERIMQIHDQKWFEKIANTKWNKVHLEPLRIGNENIGYLFIATIKWFSETQVKSIWTIALAIAGFINQKHYFESIKNDWYYEIEDFL